ncbi:helix-turn-helix transcriptional regulator [uncultured Selenomonas sp.]|uniref:helix-turn-helix domain-containing protein n=1 Tax=uncultured Selenomonas sp. TaxID=159275 RepID=UPI0025EF32BE|nr:helix-turn-helix transcriptional regulator [uncultured Selenomonas sp.]
MKPVFTYKLNEKAVRDRVALTGYTAREVASKSGLSDLTVTRAFKGNAITAATLKKLADALGANPLELAAE